MDQREALEWVEAVQTDRFEGSEVSVKAARRGLPSRLYETLSAFANRMGGGVVILGLDEARDFAAIGVDDPQQTLAELGDQASRMKPPLRLTPVVARVGGSSSSCSRYPNAIIGISLATMGPLTRPLCLPSLHFALCSGRWTRPWLDR